MAAVIPPRFHRASCPSAVSRWGGPRATRAAPTVTSTETVPRAQTNATNWWPLAVWTGRSEERRLWLMAASPWRSKAKS
eukprot:scaffold18306_cov84-Phaeocystis_antarctica.AAC.1